MVSDVRASNGGFRVRLDDGECVDASRVVVAAGIAGFPNIPRELDRLVPRFASHTSTERDLSRFAGRRVAVVGGGQSALESAALLREAGTDVEVLLRAPIIHWIGHPCSPGLPPLPGEDLVEPRGGGRQRVHQGRVEQAGRFGRNQPD